MTNMVRRRGETSDVKTLNCIVVPRVYAQLYARRRRPIISTRVFALVKHLFIVF